MGGESSVIRSALDSFKIPQLSVSFELRDQQLQEEHISFNNRISRSAESISTTKSSLNNHGEKPTFVIHVGPSKTGTTMLQCSLIYTDTKEHERIYFKKDNYRYIGTRPRECGFGPDGIYKKTYLRNAPGDVYYGHGTYWTMLQGSNVLPKDSIFATEVGRFFEDAHQVQPSGLKMADVFRNETETLLRHGENGLYVFEGFDRATKSHVEALGEFLKDFNVKVILNYRKLYEWLPSFYSELVRIRDVHQYHFPETKYNNESDILPFALENRGIFTEMVHDFERHRKHPSQIIRERFSRVFSDVSVIDIHNFPDENDYKAHMFCDIIHANTTCDAFRTGKIKSRSHDSNNPAFKFAYDMIIMAAFRKGIISSRLPRNVAFEAVEALQEYRLNLGQNDYPLICMPDSELQRIFNLSLEAEKSIMGEFEGQREKHWKGFEKYVARKKFCHVDVDKVMEEDDRLRRFLAVVNEKCADITKWKSCNTDVFEAFHV